MEQRLRVASLPVAVVSAAWLVLLATVAGELVLDRALAAAGRGDLVPHGTVVLAFGVGILSAAVVGSALALRRPRHPVGWLFLLFAVVVAVPLDAYVALAVAARPGALPAASLLAVIADVWYVPLLALPGLIMLLTPSGRLAARPWRIAAWAIVLGALLTFGLKFWVPYDGEYAALGTVRTPLALPQVEQPLTVVRYAAMVVLHLGVLVAAASLVVRTLAARDRERRQLRLLAWAAVPFGCFVVGAFIAAQLDHQTLLSLMAGGIASIIPLTAALAIEQYHLYDIERLVSRAVVWGVLSVLLACCYATVVVVAGAVVGRLGGGTQIPAIVATLVTISLLDPARRWLQDALDRRFNRRRFDALATIRRWLREPSPDSTVEQALRAALGDPTLTVAYWIEERACWVSAAGDRAGPDPAALVLHRHDRPVCAITFDVGRVEQDVAVAVASEALAELENARLRAAITLQLVEVRASRARIAAAQLAERRKIERNLHDGAQQRLLALALQLRAAEVNQRPERMRTAIGAAVDQLQLAIEDLRGLANGLLPPR